MRLYASFLLEQGLLLSFPLVVCLALPSTWLFRTFDRRASIRTGCKCLPECFVLAVTSIFEKITDSINHRNTFYGDHIGNSWDIFHHHCFWR